MKIENVSGQCLCKTVTVNARAVSTSLGVCHCEMCRTWSGGPFITVDCAEEVTFSNAKDITRYSSSAWAERGFCTRCGTHLFYYLKETGVYYLPVGLLGIEEKLVLTTEIFVDEKPQYYDFANHTEQLTGAEFIAQFAQAGQNDEKGS